MSQRATGVWNRPRPSLARTGSAWGASGLRRVVDIHRLDADPARPGEAVDHQVEAGPEDAGGDAVDDGVHPHRGLLVEPAARLDVDGLARRQRLLEHVAVAVQPQDAVAAVAVEFVDEEAGAAEQHVGDALEAGERVVDRVGGGEKLVLAHLQLAALRQVIGTMWPAPSRLK